MGGGRLRISVEVWGRSSSLVVEISRISSSELNDSSPNRLGAVHANVDDRLKGEGEAMGSGAIVVGWVETRFRG